MSTSRKIVLAKPADWDAWISFVRTRASTNTKIWHLVNSDLCERPNALLEPIESGFKMPANNNQFDSVKFKAYKAWKDLFKSQLAKYERQEKAFSDLLIFIQETIAAHNITFIQKAEPHPWNILRALKLRLALSDKARNIEIEERYHKLCKGPGTQSIDAWLDDWTATYTDAKDHDIAEATGTRPIQDFLRAARMKESSFADAHLVLIRSNKSTHNFFGLIKDFRQHICLEQPSKGNTHSAFTANSSASSKPQAASFRGQQLSDMRPCVCGDTHWLADCPYLVQKVRTKGWTANPAKQKRVDEFLWDEEIKAWVTQTLEKHAKRDSRLATSRSEFSSAIPSSQAKSPEVKGLGAFTVQPAFSATTFRLQGS